MLGAESGPVGFGADGATSMGSGWFDTGSLIRE